jgi:hypothetical protein
MDQALTGVSARLIIRDIGLRPADRKTCLTQCLGLLLRLRGVSIDQGHNSAFLAIQLSDRSTNAATGPSDQYDAPGVSRICHSLFSSLLRS